MRLQSKEGVRSFIEGYLVAIREPVTTRQVTEAVQGQTNKLTITSNRISQYLQASKNVTFDKKKKQWQPTVQPLSLHNPPTL